MVHWKFNVVNKIMAISKVVGMYEEMRGWPLLETSNRKYSSFFKVVRRFNQAREYIRLKYFVERKFECKFYIHS
jgi:hypothetical protein